MLHPTGHDVVISLRSPCLVMEFTARSFTCMTDGAAEADRWPRGGYVHALSFAPLILPIALPVSRSPGRCTLSVCSHPHDNAIGSKSAGHARPGGGDEGGSGGEGGVQDTESYSAGAGAGARRSGAEDEERESQGAEGADELSHADDDDGIAVEVEQSPVAEVPLIYDAGDVRALNECTARLEASAAQSGDIGSLLKAVCRAKNLKDECIDRVAFVLSRMQDRRPSRRFAMHLRWPAIWRQSTRVAVRGYSRTSPCWPQALVLVLTGAATSGGADAGPGAALGVGAGAGAGAGGAGAGAGIGAGAVVVVGAGAGKGMGAGEGSGPGPALPQDLAPLACDRSAVGKAQWDVLLAPIAKLVPGSVAAAVCQSQSASFAILSCKWGKVLQGARSNSGALGKGGGTGKRGAGHKPEPGKVMLGRFAVTASSAAHTSPSRTASHWTAIVCHAGSRTPHRATGRWRCRGKATVMRATRIRVRRIRISDTKVPGWAALQ